MNTQVIQVNDNGKIHLIEIDETGKETIKKTWTVNWNSPSTWSERTCQQFEVMELD